MKKLEHIGIAVKDLEAAKTKYKVILGVACYKEEVVESENVLTAFFQTADQKIELLQSTSNDSAIAKFIEQRGEGMHHIAFEVDDLEKEINDQLKKEITESFDKANKEDAIVPSIKDELEDVYSNNENGITSPATKSTT